MQFLPSIFEQAQGAVKSARTTAARAYSGLQNAQAGNSFGAFMQKEVQERLDMEKAQEQMQAYYAQADKQAAKLEEMLTMSEIQKNAQSILDEFAANAYGMNNSEENSLSDNFLSPYSDANGANISSDAIRLNEDEVNTLIENLQIAGFNQSDVINALKDASKNLNGASSEYLLQEATNALMGEAQRLTKLEEQQLLAMSQKLMNGEMSSEDILNSIQMQGANGALDTIANAIESKGSITFTSEEINALGTMLQLSDAEKAKLDTMLSQVGSVTLDKEGFNHLMSSARNEINSKQETLVGLTNAMAQNLESLEASARNRMELELSTQNYEDKQTELSRKTMENTQLDKILEDYKNNEFEEDTLISQIMLLDDTEKVETIRETKTSSLSSLENTLKNALNVERENTDTNTSSKKENNSSSFGQSLSSSQAQSQTNTVKVEGSLPSYASTVSTQVQDAVANAMKNNLTKIEVELNPVELGALTVVLSSKNGEMSAQIQSERLETMHTINQQVDAIKRELEGQGIKLESIEVDLKSSDSHQFAEHRESQEFGQESQQKHETMEQQVNDLNRLRVLGRGINEGWIDESALSEEELELAQNLLDSDEENPIFDTENGLYINTVA